MSKGSILIILLWILTFLFFVGLEVSFVVERSARLLSFEKRTLMLQTTAWSGVEYGRWLLSQDRREVDSLQDQWARLQVQDPVKLTPGLWFELRCKDHENVNRPCHGIEDLESKLSLRGLSLDQLNSFLPGKREGDQPLVENVESFSRLEDLLQLREIYGLDFRTLVGEDQNDDGVLNVNEDDGMDWEPGDNRDRAMDWGLRDWLAIQSSKVNVNTVNRTALNHLFSGSPEVVDSLLQFRTAGGVLESVPSVYPQQGFPKGYFSTRSEWFIIRSHGCDSEGCRRVKILAHRDGKGVRIMRELGL